MTTSTLREKRTSGQGLRLFIQLLPIIGLFWVYMFLRWHDIAKHFPYFIDEIHHVRRARAVWAFNDLHTSTTPGKFLLYYWIGAFQLPEFPPLWLVRTSATMLSLLGAAGTFALARILFNRWAGFLALALVTVFPFILFYERMALTDSLAAAFAVLMAWWSVIVARQPTQRNATILAVFYCLMMGAKILAFPLTIVPFLAIALLGPQPISFKKPLREEIRRLWNEYRPVILRATIIIAIVWGALIGFYQTRKILDPNTRAIVDDYLYGGVSANISGTDSGRSQLSINMERVGQVFTYFWGVWLSVLALLAVLVLLWRRWRVAWYLLAGILALWIFIIFVAGQLNSRYLTLVAQICAVMIAGGTIVMYQEIRGWFKQSPLQWLAWTPLAALGIWAVTFALPFARTDIRNPVDVELPRRDQSEYFRNYTGYALPDGLKFIASSVPISQNSEKPVAVSWVRVCEFLPYHMPVSMHDDLTLICPPPDTPDAFLMRFDLLNTALENYGAVYLMVEQFQSPDGSLIVDPTQINGSVEFLAAFERPHDGVRVEIYRVDGTGKQRIIG